MSQLAGVKSQFCRREQILLQYRIYFCV